MSKKLSFSHYNIHSLCSSFSLFSEFLSEESFDIFSLSETLLDASISDYGISIANYKLGRIEEVGVEVLRSMLKSTLNLKL